MKSLLLAAQRQSILLIAAIVCAVCLPLQASTNDVSSSATRPNVLFIAADDLNTNMGCYGHPLVKTPNLDKLAARGVRFNHAQCTYPLCNPSRSSILSGLRPERTQIMDNNTSPRLTMPDTVFLPEYFSKYGYQTARGGKIAHNTFEDNVKWDVVLTGNAAGPGGTEINSQNGGTTQAAARRQRRQAARAEAAGEADADGANRKERAGARRDATRQTSSTNTEIAEASSTRTQVAQTTKTVPMGAVPLLMSDEETADGRTARAIVKQLERAKASHQPFFIACGFHKPHEVFSVPQKYFDMYPLEKIQLPLNEPPDDRKDIPPLSLRRNRPDPVATPDERRNAMRGYYASISFMDAQAGLVLDALDRLELTSNTVIVFFGDHGQHLGEHGGLYRKTSLFEEAARSPMIWAAPGITKAGGVSQRPVDFLSIFPTLTELCGIPANPVAEGFSLISLLKNPDAAWPHSAVTTLAWKGTVGHSIRTDRYRYNEWDNGKQGRELYDHETDPQEYKNLADNPKYKKQVDELHEEIVRTVARPNNIKSSVGD